MPGGKSRCYRTLKRQRNEEVILEVDPPAPGTPATVPYIRDRLPDESFPEFPTRRVMSQRRCFREAAKFQGVYYAAINDENTCSNKQ